MSIEKKVCPSLSNPLIFPLSSLCSCSPPFSYLLTAHSPTFLRFMSTNKQDHFNSKYKVTCSISSFAVTKKTSIKCWTTFYVMCTLCNDRYSQGIEVYSGRWNHQLKRWFLYSSCGNSKFSRLHPLFSSVFFFVTVTPPAGKNRKQNDKHQRQA